MLFFIDEINKIFYIMAPKCGTTTIARMLNINLHKEYDLSNINNPEYKKIIIIRKNVVNRFLSGFYEDLFNNTCYDNINLTFNDYLLFLYKGFQEKIPYLDNINIYNGQNIPIWFGNCSGVSLSITNDEGNFISHIQSQKTAISYIVNLIDNKTNVEIVELNNLSKITNNIKENIKNPISKLPDEINDFSLLSLSYIKKNKIIINDNFLNDTQKEIILDIYKEDLIFINELKVKFSNCS
jgi:hypothetical protein